MADNYKKIRNTTNILCVVNMVMAYYSSDLPYVLEDTGRKLFYIALHIGIIVVAGLLFVIYSKQDGYFYKKLKRHSVFIMAAAVFMLINRLFFAGIEMGTITLPTSPWLVTNAALFLDIIFVFITALPMYEFYAIKKFGQQVQNDRGNK